MLKSTENSALNAQLVHSNQYPTCLMQKFKEDFDKCIFDFPPEYKVEGSIQ